MQKRKEYQPPMTIEAQIDNLKSIGLVISDEAYAKKILNDISYFRLIKAYSLNLKSKNGLYNENISFEKIVELYLFNANFRQIIFPRIEINMRCRVANYFAEEYGVLGYLDAKNFAEERFHKEFLEDIEEEIRRNAKSHHLYETSRKIMREDICRYMRLLNFLVLVHYQSFIKTCIMLIRKLWRKHSDQGIHILRAGWKVYHM